MTSPSHSHSHSQSMASLSRQSSSIYSLTLNEVQSYLAEPLHSMNLDDLLRNVISEAEAEAEAQAAAAAADSNSSPPLRLHRPPPAITRQPSLTMPSFLSKKTVDEVWRDIQTSVLHRQSSLGEMTLEDFLSKAGVVGPYATPLTLQQQPTNYAAAYLGRPLPRPVGASTGPILDMVYRDGSTGSVTAVSPMTPARKRSVATVEDVQEKTVERRQKRMIKNRESAARSRARKQAYTNELENKIARLEEEIARLTQEKKLIQDAQYVPQPEPKNPLRRMGSCNF